MNKYIDAEKLIAEIRRRIDSWKLRGEHSPEGQGKDTCVSRVTELTDLLSFITSPQQEEPGAWIKIDEDHPLPYGQEVIGYNKEWVHEDFNPSGTRIGFYTDVGFFSAKWVNDQDCYATCLEEGDDYETFQIQPDGTRKTWCKYEHGEAVEGYLPNMPTHYMLIPTTPDGFAWPYEKVKEEDNI